MINYYYELNEGVKVFGQPARYIAMYDIKPNMLVRNFHGPSNFHQAASSESSQVWMENANGISLVRENGRDVHKAVAPEVITWLKLICKDVETF